MIRPSVIASSPHRAISTRARSARLSRTAAQLTQHRLIHHQGRCKYTPDRRCIHLTSESIDVTFMEPDAEASTQYQGIGLRYGYDGVVVDIGFVGDEQQRLIVAGHDVPEPG